MLLYDDHGVCLARANAVVRIYFSLSFALIRQSSAQRMLTNEKVGDRQQPAASLPYHADQSVALTFNLRVSSCPVLGMGLGHNQSVSASTVKHTTAGRSVPRNFPRVSGLLRGRRAVFQTHSLSSVSSLHGADLDCDHSCPRPRKKTIAAPASKGRDMTRKYSARCQPSPIRIPPM